MGSEPPNHFRPQATSPSSSSFSVSNSLKAYQVEFESLAVELDGKKEWLLKEKGPSQQNKNLEKMITAHATTSQSQLSSRPINAPSNDLENRRCALLNWNNYEEDEVVVEGKISSTNPSTKVNCVPLGRECWKVWVDVVFDECQNMEVYRATMDA